MTHIIWFILYGLSLMGHIIWINFIRIVEFSIYASFIGVPSLVDFAIDFNQSVYESPSRNHSSYKRNSIRFSSLSALSKLNVDTSTTKSHRTKKNVEPYLTKIFRNSYFLQKNNRFEKSSPNLEK